MHNTYVYHCGDGCFGCRVIRLPAVRVGVGQLFFSFSAVHNSYYYDFFFFFSRCCGVERERNAREITMTDERAATCKAELPTLAPCIVACMTFSLLTPILCENT